MRTIWKHLLFVQTMGVQRSLTWLLSARRPYYCTLPNCNTSETGHTKRAALPLPIRKPKAKVARPQTFVDYKQVHVVGGNGGKGMSAFFHTRSSMFGGPSGGDGGHGAHIIFKADARLRSLSHLRDEYIGGRGWDGGLNSCHGANAEHTEIPVPLHTAFKTVTDGRIVCELKKEGALFVAARGGAGGHGNQFFLTNDNRSPMYAEPGGVGEDLIFDVELRVIAHAGLVGFPNAGKSTLLRAVSRASPKVAAYPFTTLKPHVGVVPYDDYVQLTVADIPGLLPGAHKNWGLGHSFLRHVERCMCLFYVIDLSLDEPWEQLDALKFELEQHMPGLSQRPCAVVANKIDIPKASQRFEALRTRTTLPLYPISAKHGTGIFELLVHFRELYDKCGANWLS